MNYSEFIHDQNMNYELNYESSKIIHLIHGRVTDNDTVARQANQQEQEASSNVGIRKRKPDDCCPLFIYQTGPKQINKISTS
jgi:hypothetical protein